MLTLLPTLALNSQGELVKTVQTNPTKIGFTVPAGEANQSVFRAGTMDAVKQFQDQRKTHDLNKFPGTYTTTHQCISVTFDVTDAAGLTSIFKVKGNIDIRLCDDAIAVSIPYQLDKALKDSKLPVKIPEGFDLAGHVMPRQ